MNVGTITTFDVPQNARDISQIFYSLTFPETPLLNSIVATGQVSATRIDYYDDVLPPTGSRLTADYAAGSGSMTLAETAGLRPTNAIIRIANSLYRVTNINQPTKTISILPLKNDNDYSNSQIVEFLNNAKPQASTPEESDYTPPEKRYNITQIIDDTAEISGTQEAVTKEIGPDDLLADNVAKKLRRLYFQLGKMIWSNIRYEPKNRNEAGLMGGVDFYIDEYGLVTTPTLFTMDNFDAFLFELSQRGTTINECWMNPLNLDIFSQIDNDKLVVNKNDLTVTGRPKPVQYHSKFGHVVNLKTDLNATPGSLRFFRSSTIYLKPLKGRQLQLLPIPQAKDASSRWILGEYTLEIHECKQMGKFVLAS